MPGPEATIERRIVKDAKGEGWTVRKVTFPGTRGAPDRIFGKDGRCMMIEFKRKDGEARLQQLRRQNELKYIFGIEVYMCDNIEHGRLLLSLKG